MAAGLKESSPEMYTLKRNPFRCYDGKNQRNKEMPHKWFITLGSACQKAIVLNRTSPTHMEEPQVVGNLWIFDLHLIYGYFVQWTSEPSVCTTVYCLLISCDIMKLYAFLTNHFLDTSLEVNYTIRDSFLQQHLYADCESKSHSINLHNAQLLVLLVFQQNKWRVSIHFHSSLTNVI